MNQAQRIREIREASGFSQDDVVQEAVTAIPGLTRQGLSMIERGAVPASAETYSAIEAAIMRLAKQRVERLSQMTATVESNISPISMLRVEEAVTA